MHLVDSILLAAALHAGVLLASSRIVPALGEDEEGISQDTLYVFRQILVEQSEQVPEPEDVVASTPADGEPDGLERAYSRCGGHRGGSMGEPTAADARHRYGVQGPVDNPDPHIARLHVPNPAARDGTMGFTPTDWPGDTAAPIEPWGRDDALGNDAISAQGNVWGEVIGLSLGSPGAGVGLKRICPICGDDARGAAPDIAGDTAGGGATGTERAH